MSNKEETSQQDHPPEIVRFYVCVCVCVCEFFVRFFNPCPQQAENIKQIDKCECDLIMCRTWDDTKC
jgi:hypothetical protein